MSKLKKYEYKEPELAISLFSAERIAALTDSGDPNNLLAGLESYEVKAQVDFQDIVAFNNNQS